MGKINVGRVLLGGLVAGLVINVGEFVLNVPILGATIEAAIADSGLSASTLEMVIWPVYAFVIGIAGVWLYAAIRPRFGPGARTAVYAGLALWVIAWGTFVVQALALPIFPASLMWISLLWGLVELPVAILAGAAIYQEPGEPEPAMARV